MGDKIMVLKLGVSINSSRNCLGQQSEKYNFKGILVIYRLMKSVISNFKHEVYTYSCI